MSLTHQQMLDRIQFARNGSLKDSAELLGALVAGDAPYIGGGSVDATAAEINRATDLSARIVAVTTTPLAIVEATHEGKTIVLNKVDGLAVTLPAATGGGARYRFYVKATSTSVGYVISAAGTDIIQGNAFMKDGDGDPANGWLAGATTNTITLGGATNATGGVVGDVIWLEDVASGVWSVQLFGSQGGTEATPFSHV